MVARVDIWNVKSPHIGPGTPFSESPLGLRTPPKTPPPTGVSLKIEPCVCLCALALRDCVLAPSLFSSPPLPSSPVLFHSFNPLPSFLSLSLHLFLKLCLCLCLCLSLSKTQTTTATSQQLQIHSLHPLHQIACPREADFKPPSKPNRPALINNTNNNNRLKSCHPSLKSLAPLCDAHGGSHRDRASTGGTTAASTVACTICTTYMMTNTPVLAHIPPPSPVPLPFATPFLLQTPGSQCPQIPDHKP